jgi:hypothetical protein
MCFVNIGELGFVERSSIAWDIGTVYKGPGHLINILITAMCVLEPAS